MQFCFCFSWLDVGFCQKDLCSGAVYGSNDSSDPFTFEEAIGCYRRLVMTSFDRINASWITFNTQCYPEHFGYPVSDEQVKNMQEMNMEVYSGTKCDEKFPNVYCEKMNGGTELAEKLTLYGKPKDSKKVGSICLNDSGGGLYQKRGNKFVIIGMSFI